MAKGRKASYKDPKSHAYDKLGRNIIKDDVHGIALECEATRLLASNGFEWDGSLKEGEEPDSVMPNEWLADDLFAAYVQIYGGLTEAAEMYRNNRLALLQPVSTGNADMSDFTEMVSRRTISALGTTHLTPEEAGMPTKVEKGMKGTDFAYAPEVRHTSRDKWVRAESPFGACYDPYGDVLYGFKRLAPLWGGHTVTHTLSDGSQTTYTPLNVEVVAKRADASNARSRAWQGINRTRRTIADRPLTKAETAQLGRIKRKAAKMNIADYRDLLPKMSWLSDM